MIGRWARRLMVWLVAIVTIVAAYTIARTNPEPWSGQEILHLTVGLNEAAAIGVPHEFLMANDLRTVNLALLAKVEAGTVLSEAESLAYRQIFQQTLQASQRFLSRFDGQLTIITDHSMHTSNNISALGISGNHDHHDVSARDNFVGLLDSLDQLHDALTFIGRIIEANAAQKDLVDLISHLGVAPHTVSVPYVAPEKPWRDVALGEKFEAMLRAFKAAQFELVNSSQYWVYVDEGVARYSDLILLVQTRVHARTKSWERRIAGRFLSPQTLAPPVDLNRSLRRK